MQYHLLDSMRAYARRKLEQSGDADLGAALTAVSTPFWIHLSLVDECRRNPDPKAVAAYYPDRIEIVEAKIYPLVVRSVEYLTCPQSGSPN